MWIFFWNTLYILDGGMAMQNDYLNIKGKGLEFLYKKIKLKFVYYNL
jgi:hypothetical protein